MLKPVITPSCGKLRVLGYCSGSGNTLWKAYELQKQLESTPEGSPFEIVGIFADNPESKAAATAAAYGLPCIAIDIRAFYAERDKPLKDREVRAEFDREAISRLEPLGADMVLLAGYVWATTDAVLDRYTVINVHPADLAVTDETGLPVDYSLFDDEEAQFRYYLKLVNEQARLVGARTVLELALGNFTLDEEGQLCYNGSPAPTGLCFEYWE